jgi:hypothetical protein
MAEHEHVHRQEMVPDYAPTWPPTIWLGFLACGFIAAIALAIIILAGGGELFAVGLALFGALVMAIGAVLGFGPLRRVP